MTDDRMRQLEAEVERLGSLVAALQRQVEPDAGIPPIADRPGTGSRSRRDLLRMAGAAAVGAGGIMAVGAVPAAAVTGGSMMLGQENDANATTSLRYTTATAPQPLMKVVGATSAAGLDPLSTQQGFNGPLLALGPSGKDGVDGYASGPVGYGVLGQSDAGYGVVGATDNGVDLAAIGTGRLQQRPTATPGPGQPPGYTPAVGRFEIVRDVGGLVWVSDATAAIWHRLSSLIPFPDPRRVFDGFATPIARNTTTGAINATTKQAGGTSGVPAGASAAYCAVQVLNHTVTGPLTLFPTGAADPGIANWVANTTGGLNLSYMLVPLNSAGQFRIHSYIDGNVIVDVWGFVI